MIQAHAFKSHALLFRIYLCKKDNNLNLFGNKFVIIEIPKGFDIIVLSTKLFTSFDMNESGEHSSIDIRCLAPDVGIMNICPPSFRREIVVVKRSIGEVAQKARVAR